MARLDERMLEVAFSVHCDNVVATVFTLGRNKKSKM
jgi:hypothetical protein